MKSFLIKTGILAIILIVGENLLTNVMHVGTGIPHFELMVAFFYAVTNLIHFKLVTVISKNIRKFNMWFLGLNMAKMFVYIFFALGYVWGHAQHAKLFLLCLFITYLGFTLVEINAITRIVKRKN